MPFLLTTIQLSKPSLFPIFIICPDINFISQRKRIWGLCFWRMSFSSRNVRVFPNSNVPAHDYHCFRWGWPPASANKSFLADSETSITSIVVTSQLSLNFAEGDLIGLVVWFSFERLVFLAFFLFGLSHLASLLDRLCPTLLLCFLFVSRAWFFHRFHLGLDCFDLSSLFTTSSSELCWSVGLSFGCSIAWPTLISFPFLVPSIFFIFYPISRFVLLIFYHCIYSRFATCFVQRFVSSLQHSWVAAIYYIDVFTPLSHVFHFHPYSVVFLVVLVLRRSILLTRIQWG